MSPQHLDPDALAATAMDALDATERAAADAHLASCEQCRRELASLRRVTAGLSLAIEPEAPPASLRARTLAAATRAPASGTAALPPRTSDRAAGAPRIRWPGLAAAAALVLAVGLGVYALSLRQQIDHLQDTVTTLAGRTDALRTQLDQARRDAVRLTNTMEVLRAPDTLRVDLRSTTGITAGSSGRAYVSRTHGLVVDFERLPALPAGRVYQLWTIRTGQVASAGVFTATPGGTASITAPFPAGGEPDLVAVSIENGPNGAGAPTMEPVMVGTRR